jgi:hypothetical protein
MTEQLIAAFIISVLHGFIPGHWLPFIALAKKLGWSRSQTLRYTGIAAIAHAGGTVVIGLILAQLTRLGITSDPLESHILWGLPFESLGGTVMVLLGFWFLYRHHKHHIFIFRRKPQTTKASGHLEWYCFHCFYRPVWKLNHTFSPWHPWDGA